MELNVAAVQYPPQQIAPEYVEMLPTAAPGHLRALYRALPDKRFRRFAPKLSQLVAKKACDTKRKKIHRENRMREKSMTSEIVAVELHPHPPCRAGILRQESERLVVELRDLLFTIERSAPLLCATRP